MTSEQRAAYIHSQTACMLAAIEAMKAANHEQAAFKKLARGYRHEYERPIPPRDEKEKA